MFEASLRTTGKQSCNKQGPDPVLEANPAYVYMMGGGMRLSCVLLRVFHQLHVEIESGTSRGSPCLCSLAAAFGLRI